MKKIVIAIMTILLMVTNFTACGNSEDTEAETAETATASHDTDSEIEKCKFEIEETVDSINDFAKDHGLRSKSRLCYRSDNHIKIDTTRITSDNDLLQKYQDAVYDIVSTGNKTGADEIYYNIETVSLDEYGYFIIYITYEYEYDSDR